MKLSLDKSNWQKVLFGDVVKKVTNKVAPFEYNSDIVVEGGHINKRDFHIRDYENKNELGYLGPAFHMGFKKRQILYVSRNPHLMKVGYPDFDGICSNTTFIMETINEEVLRNDLIPFLMHSDTFIEQSVSNVRGGVNPYVNWGDLACIEFLLPPKEQQAELAELFWSMDEVIEKELTVLESLKVSREATFEELVEESQGKMTPLSKILVPKKSKSAVPHHRKKYIGLEHITSGSFNCTEYGNTEDVQAQCNIVDTGDLCYSKLRPYLDKAFIASFDAVSTTELLIYDTKDVSKDYLLYHLHSKPFVDYVSGKGFGTKMPRVSHKIIGEYQVKIVKNETDILNSMQKIMLADYQLREKLASSKSLQKSLINQVF